MTLKVHVTSASCCYIVTVSPKTIRTHKSSPIYNQTNFYKKSLKNFNYSTIIIIIEFDTNFKRPSKNIFFLKQLVQSFNSETKMKV